MCRPVPDESFANHAFGQTEPLEGGRTEDTVGEWNFLGEFLVTHMALSVRQPVTSFAC